VARRFRLYIDSDREGELARTSITAIFADSRTKVLKGLSQEGVEPLGTFWARIK